jgi:mannose-6-phosphate isomerase-like protein (cupin superfamily)
MTDPLPAEALPDPPAGPTAAAPAAPAPAPSSRDATLLLYRVLVGVLLAALIGGWAVFDHLYDEQLRSVAALEQRLAFSGPPPGASPAPLKVTDVGAHFANLSRTQAEKADYSELYYASPIASVHMHMMAEEQVCPLHIHRRTFEATVIVDGNASVTQVWGMDGALTSRKTDVGPGVLIASPPFCGHQWDNTSKTAKLGNLVFGLPQFDGNLYVKADDPRMKQGGEPFVYDPARDLQEVAAGAEPSRRRALPVLDGHMSALFVKTTARVEPHLGRPVFVYVTHGTGVIDDGQAFPVTERSLATIDGGPAVTLRAQGGPLAALVFEP